MSRGLLKGLGIFFSIGVLVMLFSGDLGEGNTATIGAAVYATLAAICFWGMSKQKKSINATKQAKKEAKYKLPVTTSVRHIMGLPLQERAQCTLTYAIEEGFVVTFGNTTYKIDAENIKDVTTTTDTEIQKSYVSSTGGAIGGAVLFGPLGAMVGGRAKQKTSKVNTNYLIVKYRSQKDDEDKYVSFEYALSSRVYEIVARFNSTMQAKETEVVTL